MTKSPDDPKEYLLDNEKEIYEKLKQNHSQNRGYSRDVRKIGGVILQRVNQPTTEFRQTDVESWSEQEWKSDNMRRRLESLCEAGLLSRRMDGDTYMYCVNSDYLSENTNSDSNTESAADKPMSDQNSSDFGHSISGQMSSLVTHLISKKNQYVASAEKIQQDIYEWCHRNFIVEEDGTNLRRCEYNFSIISNILFVPTALIAYNGITTAGQRRFVIITLMTLTVVLMLRSKRILMTRQNINSP